MTPTGIYSITHCATGKIYIGSAVHFARRWNVHRHHLRKGTHHSKYLQSAWNKYGEAAFEFKQLLTCAAEHLRMFEDRAITAFNAGNRKYGYNHGDCATRLGHMHSPETRAKIKAKRATQIFSQATRDKLRAAQTGKKMPDWFPDFMRTAKTGSVQSAEARAKISITSAARKASVETIEKRSKITLTMAEEIRGVFAQGERTQTSIAKEYGLDPSAVSLIVTGKRWNTKELSK